MRFYKHLKGFLIIYKLTTWQVVLTCLAFIVVSLALAQPNVTATKDDSVPPAGDVDNDGKADPGDDLQYIIEIFNSGNADAINVMLQDVLDGDLTLDTGSVQITPIAFDDSYDVLGNVGITVNAAGGVLANDIDPDSTVPLSNTGLTAVTLNTTGTQGTVSNFMSNGSFTYTPPTGFTGTTTFQYTARDADNLDSIVTGVVTLDVSDIIWFIDNSHGGANEGTLSDPFQSINDFNTANGGGASTPQTGHSIYLAETGTDYTTGITLLDNQVLIGEGAGVSGDTLTAILSITLPSHSNTLPPVGGTNPVIANSVGNGITLANNNTVRGLDVTGSNIAGISGNTVTDGTFQDIGISGGVQGINLTSVSGSFTFTNDVPISNTSGTAFKADQGNGSVTYPSTINNTSGLAVEITNRTGGTITLSGNISDTGATGIFLNNNDISGGSIGFTGQVDITNSTGTAVTVQNSNSGTTSFADLDIDNSTSNQRGLFATGNSGSTLNTTTGTIDSGTATAVDIDSTALGITLTKVDSNGGAAVGIDILDTTGSFTVAGDGGNTRNGTGGTITNKSGRGVRINRATNISLNSMNITSTGDDGIFAGGTGATDNVNGFALRGVLLQNNGNAVDEHGVEFRDVLGTVVIENSRFTNPGEDTFRFFNNGGTLGSLTITNSEFDNSGSGSGLNFELLTSATMSGTATLTANNFHDNFATGAFFINNSSAGKLEVTIGDSTNATRNTFTTNNIAIDVSHGPSTGTTIWDIVNNDITDTNSHGMNFFVASGSSSTATVQGKVRNNILRQAGSSNGGGNGIRVNLNDAPPAIVEITGNDIDTHAITPSGFNNGRGIEVTSRLGNKRNDVTITNNIVRVDDAEFPLEAIFVTADSGQASDNVTLCAEISGNTAVSTDSVPANFDLGIGIHLVQTRSPASSGPSQIILPGLGANPTIADVESFVFTKNPNALGDAANVQATRQDTTGFAGGSACNTVP